MTNIQEIPIEILQSIFKHLDQKDLFQCQNVCSTWYCPIHLKILNQLDLCSPLAIDQFIASIDHNPSTSYLKAIKTICITISTNSSADYQLDTEKIKKLLCRFPNLSKVDIQIDQLNSVLLSQFNDEICKNLLTCCTKLDEFKVDFSYKYIDGYFHPLYNVQLLLTTMDSTDVFSAVEEQGNPVEFVSRFPRLKRIVGGDVAFRNLTQYLPVIEQLSNLKEIYLYAGDEDNFERDYFATKTKEEKETLVKKLSNITDLQLHLYTTHTPCSIVFASKYMTGLDTFRIISSHGNDEWNIAQEEVFRNNILDLACNAKIKGEIDFSLSFTILTNCFPCIVNKVPKQTPSLNKVFSLKINDINEDLAYLRVDQTSVKQKVEVVLDIQFDLNEAVNTLFEKTAAINVDEFILCFLKYGRAVDVHMFDKFLGKMPGLKKITLQIPVSFKDDSFMCDDIYDDIVHHKVEEVALAKTNENTETQSLLDRYFLTFPNLKYMTLSGFCGMHVQGGRSHIKLSRYSLERLSIDVSPIALEVKKALPEQVNAGEIYAVLQVHLLKTNERYLYVFSLDLRTTVMVDDVTLEECSRGQKIMGPTVTIDSLQRLDLLVETSIFSWNHYPREFFDGNTKSVIVFD